MPNTRFDAFGEPLSPLAKVAELPQGRVSRVVMRLGVGVFWSLVIAIVAARVVTFDPDFASTFGAFAARCVQTVLNG